MESRKDVKGERARKNWKPLAQAGVHEDGLEHGSLTAICFDGVHDQQKAPMPFVTELNTYLDLETENLCPLSTEVQLKDQGVYDGIAPGAPDSP